MRKINEYCYQVTGENQGQEIIRILTSIHYVKNPLGLTGTKVSNRSYYYVDEHNILKCIDSDFFNIKSVRGFNLEITGYKCPIALCDGLIPKDTIFTKCKLATNYYTATLNVELIPKEIVETWEPVYKKTFKDLPDIKGYKGEIDEINKRVVYGCQKISFDEVKNITDFIIKYKLDCSFIFEDRQISPNTIKEVWECLVERGLIA